MDHLTAWGHEHASLQTRTAIAERLVDDAFTTMRSNRSSGNRRPVLSVGRDGITLRDYQHSYYEVATAATVSVCDRAGKRLGTVYLAHPPEANQVTDETPTQR